MEIDTAKPNNPTPPSENVAGFQLTLLFSNSRYYRRMVDRQFWHSRIENVWKRRSVVWLSGVRRVGKTCLCQTLPNIEYFDCELPRVRRLMEDPQAFLDSVGQWTDCA